MDKTKQTSGKYPPIKGISTLVKEGEIAFVHIDTESFQKTGSERLALKRIQLEHKRSITSQGCDPKKILNPF